MIDLGVIVALLISLMYFITGLRKYGEALPFFPYYWFVICALALAIWRSWRRDRAKLDAELRDQRKQEGCCPNCGYDLRAERRGRFIKCPECGTKSKPSEIAEPGDG